MNIIEETVLEQYFLFQAVLCRHINDGELFGLISEKLLLDKEEAQELFALTQIDTVKEIVTPSDAMRFARIRQYNELNGKQPFTDLVCQTVALKTHALSTAESNGLLTGGHSTKSMVYNALNSVANVGNVTAMRILGFILCEGKLVKKNFLQGQKLLSRTAEWGDGLGTLMLLSYLTEKSDLAENVSRLNACVCGTEYATFYQKACEKYNVQSVAPSEEVILLKKAISSMRFKSEVYDAQGARLLFEKGLTASDKEKVIFSENKSLLSEVCSLPLKLRNGAISAQKSPDFSPLHREKEQNRVFAALRNADLRQRDSYRPICLVSRSDYILNAYADLLSSLNTSETKLERMDFADLKQSDFETTGNNIFVRSACDGKNNVYLLMLVGAVEDFALEGAKNFLDTVKRRRFHLTTPLVTLNLDPILPICICDEANADKIKDAVDIVRLADVSQSEKRALLSRMISDKSDYYLHRTVETEESALDELCACSRSQAEFVLDRVFGDNRFSEGFNCVTADAVHGYVKLFGNKSRAYGFGGYDHEIH